MLKKLLLTLFMCTGCLAVPGKVQASVVINEIHPSEEWIELYNTSVDSEELGGCVVDMGSSSQQVTLANEQLPPGNFKVLEKGVTSGWSTNWLNNSGDSVELTCPNYTDGPITYPSLASTESYARLPNGTGTFQETQSTSKGSTNIMETATNSPNPTSTPEPAKASVEIADATDESGVPLTTVKIYIDGTYTNHYAPENFTFCAGCYCNNAACGLGKHTFRLEKAGYALYEEQITVEPGNSYKIKGTLAAESQNAESGPAPNTSPTPETSFSVSLPLSKAPSPSPSAKAGQPESVLGVNSVVEEENVEKESAPYEKPFPKSAYFFLAIGGLLLSYSVFVFLKGIRERRVASGKEAGNVTKKESI